MTDITECQWSVLQAYERVRNRFPTFAFENKAPTRLQHFSEIIDRYDVFLFDAFGVLNIGDQEIPGASERISQLQALGKQTLLVSNAASYSAKDLGFKYRQMGFCFQPEQTVFSREVLLHHVSACFSGLVGVIGVEGADYSDLPFDHTVLNDALSDYDRVDAFVFLSASHWNQERHHRLILSLTQNPRSVWIANPDLVAPRETEYSLEPGHYAALLDHHCTTEMRYFGKPFADIFYTALKNRVFKAPDNEC